MKKIFLFFILTGFAFAAQAQSIGVIAGGDFSTFTRDAKIYKNHKMVAGTHFFVFASKEIIDDVFAIRPSFGIAQKGYNDILFDLKYKLNDIQFDLDAQIGALDFFSIDLGVYTSYAFKGTYKGTFSNDIVFGKNGMSSFDFGLTFGATYYYNLAPNIQVLGGIKNEFGVIDLYNNTSTKYNNYTLRLFVGVKFGS